MSFFLQEEQQNMQSLQNLFMNTLSFPSINFQEAPQSMGAIGSLSHIGSSQYPLQHQEVSSIGRISQQEIKGYSKEFQCIDNYEHGDGYQKLIVDEAKQRNDQNCMVQYKENWMKMKKSEMAIYQGQYRLKAIISEVDLVRNDLQSILDYFTQTISNLL